MTYVLIIFAFYGSGVTTTTQEFNNQAACEYARKQVKELVYHAQTACVPKETRE